MYLYSKREQFVLIYYKLFNVMFILRRKKKKKVKVDIGFGIIPF